MSFTGLHSSPWEWHNLPSCKQLFIVTISGTKGLQIFIEMPSLCYWICELPVPEPGSLVHTTSSLPLCVNSPHKEGEQTQACWLCLLRLCDYLVICRVWLSRRTGHPHNSQSAAFWKQHHWSREGVYIRPLPLPSDALLAIIQRQEVDLAHLSFLSLLCSVSQCLGGGGVCTRLLSTMS